MDTVSCPLCIGPKNVYRGAPYIRSLIGPSAISGNNVEIVWHVKVTVIVLWCHELYFRFSILYDRFYRHLGLRINFLIYLTLMYFVLIFNSEYFVLI